MQRLSTFQCAIYSRRFYQFFSSISKQFAFNWNWQRRIYCEIENHILLQLAVWCDLWLCWREPSHFESPLFLAPITEASLSLSRRPPPSLSFLERAKSQPISKTMMHECARALDSNTIFNIASDSSICVDRWLLHIYNFTFDVMCSLRPLCAMCMRRP